MWIDVIAKAVVRDFSSRLLFREEVTRPSSNGPGFVSTTSLQVTDRMTNKIDIPFILVSQVFVSTLESVRRKHNKGREFFSFDILYDMRMEKIRQESA